MSTVDPRVPDDLRDSASRPLSDHLDDPLRLCIATTVALVAWLVTPPLAVALFGVVAIVGYVRARRAGLLSSRCKLGDTRLVLAYLTVATLAGVVGVAQRLG